VALPVRRLGKTNQGKEQIKGGEEEQDRFLILPGCKRKEPKSSFELPEKNEKKKRKKRDGGPERDG